MTGRHRRLPKRTAQRTALRGVPAALIALLGGTLAGLAHAAPPKAGTHSVALDVLRSEDPSKGLKWTGPCSVRWYAAGKEPQLVATLKDADAAAQLPKGHYEGVVKCPSTEGALTQVIQLRVKGRDVVKTVTMIPAFLLVRITREDGDWPGDVVVRDKSGRVVQRGKDRTVLPVPVGRLLVTGTVDPIQLKRKRLARGTLAVRTRAGKKTQVILDARDATLLVKLTENGKHAQGVVGLYLKGKGERISELPVWQATAVPPGDYDVVTQLENSYDFHSEKKRGVKLRPGKKTTLAMVHQTGTLLPVLLKDGAPFTGQAKVALFWGAALTSFNTLDVGEAALVQPGAYRVVVTLKTLLDDGTAQQAQAKVSVRKGKTSRVKIDLSAAALDVTTRVGEKFKRLPVSVFVVGKTAPVARKKSSRKGKLHLALPPGKYRVQALLKGEPPLTEARDVTLKRGKQSAVEVHFDVGKAMVQVFEASVAVQATVAFYKEGAAAPYLEANSGVEVWLPPGRYEIAARRHGKTQRFGHLTVNPHRLAERRVEIAQ